MHRKDFPKTKLELLAKLDEIARRYFVEFIPFHKDTVDIGGRNQGGSAGCSGKNGGGVITLGDPDKDYDSYDIYVMCFFHELSHCILGEVMRLSEKFGHYSDLLRNECIWRKEFWCWNNAMDLWRSIFGIQLDKNAARWIMDNLRTYIDLDSDRSSFYYDDEYGGENV